MSWTHIKHRRISINKHTNKKRAEGIQVLPKRPGDLLSVIVGAYVFSGLTRPIMKMALKHLTRHLINKMIKKIKQNRF